MESIFSQFKNAIAVILFSISFSALSSDLPDPEVLAKQYLKDLCTLNEQDFTRKYMLMQSDADNLINETIASYKKLNLKMPGERFPDSLAIRSKVHKRVVRSYRDFKEWQHDNQIDSSKIVYNSCEFELEKKRDIPFYGTDDIKIYFTVDTSNYKISCDDFLFMKSKWIGGDIDGIISVDKNFNPIYNDSDEYDYAVDTVAAVYNENDNSYTEVAQPVFSKKQLKIQKKIDAYNRKIDALYIKQYE